MRLVSLTPAELHCSSVDLLRSMPLLIWAVLLTSALQICRTSTMLCLSVCTDPILFHGMHSWLVLGPKVTPGSGEVVADRCSHLQFSSPCCVCKTGLIMVRRITLPWWSYVSNLCQGCTLHFDIENQTLFLVGVSQATGNHCSRTVRYSFHSPTCYTVLLPSSSLPIHISTFCRTALMEPMTWPLCYVQTLMYLGGCIPNKILLSLCAFSRHMQSHHGPLC